VGERGNALYRVTWGHSDSVYTKCSVSSAGPIINKEEEGTCYQGFHQQGGKGIGQIFIIPKIECAKVGIVDKI